MTTNSLELDQVGFEFVLKEDGCVLYVNGLKTYIDYG